MNRKKSRNEGRIYSKGERGWVEGDEREGDKREGKVRKG